MIGGISAVKILGIGSWIYGAAQTFSARDTMFDAGYEHEENLRKLNMYNNVAANAINNLISYELKVIDTFSCFADIIERIHNRPQFADIDIEPAFDFSFLLDELREVSGNVNMLALCSAVTVLGGGSLLGGVVMAISGKKRSRSADEVMKRVMREKEDVEVCCRVLNDIARYADAFRSGMERISARYIKYMIYLHMLVMENNMTDWDELSDQDKMVVENCSYLVGLLYNMCKVKFLRRSTENEDIQEFNFDEVVPAINDMVLVSNASHDINPHLSEMKNS